MKFLSAVTVACALTLLAGCDESKPASAGGGNLPLPDNATEVTSLGSGWVSFKLEGHKYLYRRTTNYCQGYILATEAITVVPDDPTPRP